MIQAVFAAGVSAPEVFGEVTLDGRFGMLGRLDGPTLLQVSGAVTFAQIVGLPVRRRRPSICAVSLDGHRPQALGRHRAQAHRLRHPRADRPQPGDGLCHGDIHPENVIMTASSPRLIDWTFSMRVRPSIMSSLASA